MKVRETGLPGVLIIEPEVHIDSRGFFFESYHARRYHQLGLPLDFIQDNHSLSCRGTIRGLHAQVQRAQAKLVRVIEGEVFDVAVDIRLGSPTFGRWAAVCLSAVNRRQYFVPAGFAHGFATTSHSAQVEYKCTEYYDPDDEIVIRWNDPEIGIDWPVQQPILSPKDSAAPALRHLRDCLPRFG
jgi:dTDP-4-dehydrorhamnose 3,5-epimerase